MFVRLVSEGSGVPVLKVFVVASVIRTCGLLLSRYISFAYLGKSNWLNIVDVIVAATILIVLVCLVVNFWISLDISSISVNKCF